MGTRGRGTQRHPTIPATKDRLDAQLPLLRATGPTVPIEQGGRIFITSDGLHSKLLLRELKSLSDGCAPAEQRVAVLMQAAIDRQPEGNFTVAALFVQS